MDAATAFTSLALFNILRFPMAMLPRIITLVVEAQLSVNRVQNYLELPDIPSTPYTEKATDVPAVEMNNVDLYWSVKDEREQNLVLRNVNLRVPSGGFCLVIGSTGCGKSGLLGW